MVAEDFGERIAKNTARQLVVYHRRSGGQSQFSSLLELKAPDGRFGPLLVWVRDHLDAPLTVEDLADQERIWPSVTGGPLCRAGRRLAGASSRGSRARIARLAYASPRGAPMPRPRGGFGPRKGAIILPLAQ
jgi:hypothetical protein